ncbi:cupin domain-containing protein [Halogeometricum borinquense]|uniref:Cupin domain-containing protein n=1 Tax=Halogeometricum borinquense TaxID=60847 RepID=A0A6C0UID7_9EURY|nr:cupin domain-containing protein [Halogeometricum borinquense]QIB74363.1 cupin domain-containing protein [Halogeometricum borinquense]
MTEIVHLPDLDGTPHANVFPESEPKTIRLTLEADERVAPHDHPGRSIVLHVLDGALELELGDETHALERGDVARFDGDQDISPLATEPSTALIVLAPSPDEE